MRWKIFAVLAVLLLVAVAFGRQPILGGEDGTETDRSFDSGLNDDVPPSEDDGGNGAPPAGDDGSGGTPPVVPGDPDDGEDDGEENGVGDEGDDSGESDEDNGSGDEGEDGEPVVTPPVGPSKIWTVMFYMAYDNDIASYWDEIRADLEAVGPPPGGNFVVLVDLDGPDDTMLLHINETGTTQIPLSTLDPKWGNELNTASGQTLETFLRWSVVNFPAHHYHLFMSSHGGSWMGGFPDDTSGQSMRIWEIRSALAGAKIALGRNLDIISFEACLMGNLELAYEIHESVDYFTASEAMMTMVNIYIPTVYGGLKNNPHWHPERFAQYMVETYRKIIGIGSPPGEMLSSTDTYSAINLTRLPPLISLLDTLARQMLFNITGIGGGENLAGRQLILDIIGSPQTHPDTNTESFSGMRDFIGVSYWMLYDIGDFAQRLSERGWLLCSSQLADSVVRQLDYVVIDHVKGDDWLARDHVDATGLSIYMPCRRTPYITSYEGTRFAQDTMWDVFIKNIPWAQYGY